MRRRTLERAGCAPGVRQPRTMPQHAGVAVARGRLSTKLGGPSSCTLKKKKKHVYMTSSTSRMFSEGCGRFKYCHGYLRFLR